MRRRVGIAIVVRKGELLKQTLKPDGFFCDLGLADVLGLTCGKGDGGLPLRASAYDAAANAKDIAGRGPACIVIPSPVRIGIASE